MTPSTICAGFKCGVFPFNLNAIDCSISPEATLTQAQGGGSHDIANEVCDGDSPVLSAEQEQQSQKISSKWYSVQEFTGAFQFGVSL